ncbi:MAG: polysaccharide deacetylase family protein [Thermoleophilaceae bacterium]|nr:polysaccharide deacetylase family protein [Thermoleophilaceae bacterium]
MIAEGASIVGTLTPCDLAVLTFDDGPTPGVTEGILDALSDEGAGATFFVLLTRARRTPELLKRITDAGHEIALHGHDHRRLTNVPPASLPRLLKDSRDELEQLCGSDVRWYRPTYGAQNRPLWHAARTAGLTSVLWSIECCDWLTLPPDDYLAPVQEGSLPGSIVLLHDGFADALDGADDGSPPTLDRARLAREVVQKAREQSLRVFGVADALIHSEPRWQVWLDEVRAPLAGENRLRAGQ